MRSSRLPIPLRHLLWAAALLVALLLLTCRQIVELDIFYHLANGRSILDAGAIPRTNLFTWTDTPGFYPNPSWLFGVLAALLYGLGGFPALLLAKVAVVMGLFAVLLALMRRQGVAWPPACGWLWLVAMACAFRFTERPHLVSHLLLAVFLVLEQRHRERGGKAIFALVPLAALWANLHAGVLLGLAWLALRLAADALASLAVMRWPQCAFEPMDRGRRRTLALATVAVSAAIFLTPTPLAIFRMLFGSTGIGTVYPISEYLMPTLSGQPWFFALAGVLLLLLVPRPRTVDPVLLLPVAAFLLLAVSSNRFIPDFAIVATPLAATRLRHFDTWFRPAGRRLWQRLADGLTILVPLLLVLTVVLLPPLGARYGFGVDRREFPAGALRFLAEQPLQGRLYNALGHSGTGMYYLYPRYRLYQTSFFQVESERIVEAGLANRSPETWAAFLDKYAFASAFVDVTREQHSPLFFPAERWALVYFDDLSAIFLRRGAGNDTVIQAQEVLAAHPALFDERGGMMTGVTAEEAARAVAELRRVLAWDDDNHLAHLMLANYLRVLGQVDEALLHYGRAQELYPQSVLTAFQKGLLQREVGDFAGAIDDLRRATQLQPDNPLYWNELGVAYGMQEQYQPALEAFDRALQLDPNYAAARENSDHARQLQGGR